MILDTLMVTSVLSVGSSRRSPRSIEDCSAGGHSSSLVRWPWRLQKAAIPIFVCWTLPRVFHPSHCGRCRVVDLRSMALDFRVSWELVQFRPSHLPLPRVCSFLISDSPWPSPFGFGINKQCPQGFDVKPLPTPPPQRYIVSYLVHPEYPHPLPPVTTPKCRNDTALSTAPSPSP